MRRLVTTYKKMGWRRRWMHQDQEPLERLKRTLPTLICRSWNSRLEIKDLRSHNNISLLWYSGCRRRERARKVVCWECWRENVNVPLRLVILHEASHVCTFSFNQIWQFMATNILSLEVTLISYVVDPPIALLFLLEFLRCFWFFLAISHVNLC